MNSIYKRKVVTLGQFIIERQADFPYAKGELSRLLRDIGIAAKIVNREVFSKGGTLVVLPFKAGVGVSANQQMDRMSMMIAKGAIDYLVEQKTPFTILTTQDQGNPDLIIEGYIEDIDLSLIHI